MEPEELKPANFKDKLQYVKLKDIKEGRRYRQDYGDLDDLVESIRVKGVVQPITLSTDMDLISGGRRFRAAQKVGLTQIPALIRKIEGEIDLREIELIENLVRKDLTWAEESALILEIDRLYKTLRTDWSGRKTAQLLNKSRMTVSRALHLAEASEKFPELKELKTADEALKVVKKMEEKVIVQELRNRQQTQVLDKGIKAMLELANRSYIVGDAFKGLAGLRDNGKIDIIECDPPYGIDLNKVKRGKEEATAIVKMYNEVPAQDYQVFLDKLARELYRVAAPHSWLVFWFGPTWHHEVFTALVAGGWEVDDIPCIWVKTQGQTNAPETYLGRGYEPFFLARKGQPLLVKRGRLNVFNFSGEAGQSKYHPTQRPLDLMEEILSTVGLDMQTVLVPFVGSGVTLRAAYNCGMKAFGWDLSGEYKDRFMLEIEKDAKKLTAETE